MEHPSKIHDRKSIRLKGYDYTKAAGYFITICTKDRKPFFGKIINKEMVLNDFGKLAHQQWQMLPTRFTRAELGVFRIMPDHMHGIIVLRDLVGETLAVAPIDQGQMSVATSGMGVNPTPTNTQTVGEIVGAYKSLTANDCLQIFKHLYPGKIMGKLWQRNYYEKIIRNNDAYDRITAYIIENPKNAR